MQNVRVLGLIGSSADSQSIIPNHRFFSNCDTYHLQDNRICFSLSLVRILR